MHDQFLLQLLELGLPLWPTLVSRGHSGWQSVASYVQRKTLDYTEEALFLWSQEQKRPSVALVAK